MNSRFYKLWNENHLLYLAPSSAATAFSKQFRVGFPERLYSKPWRKEVRVHPKRFKFIIRVLTRTFPQLQGHPTIRTFCCLSMTCLAIRHKNECYGYSGKEKLWSQPNWIRILCLPLRSYMPIDKLLNIFQNQSLDL